MSMKERAVSFRARLSVVMAVVVFVPLITVALVVASRLPALRIERADAVALQAASSTAVSLTTLCTAAGDVTRTVSEAVAAQAARDALDPAALQALAKSSAEGHYGLRVVVLDTRNGAILARGGPVGAAEAYEEAQRNLDASCAEGRAPDGASMGEAIQVHVDTAGAKDESSVAAVVAWTPITPELLDALARELTLPRDTHLAVTRTSTGAIVAATDRAAVSDPIARVRDGGTPEDVAVQERPMAGTGFLAVAVTRPPDLLTLAYLAPALILAVAGVLVALIVVGRLTRPLDAITEAAEHLGEDPSARTGLDSSDEIGRLGATFDRMAEELQRKTEQLQSELEGHQRSARLLRETFEQFGEALGSTHNLGSLLEAVLCAGVDGAGAALGSIHVVEAGDLHETATLPGGDEPQDRELREGLPALRGLALDAYEEGEPVNVEAIAGAGSALAVPLLSNESVVGVIAVARTAGSGAIDAEGVERLRALAVNAGTAIANVRAHEESERLSVTDPLTGTGNVRLLTGTMAHEVERSARFGRSLAVLMLDLDHFKQVNDTLGHEFGDGVLRQFAQRLEGCLRDVDTVARYGGEEFAVILPETDAAGAVRVAERIVRAVRAAPFVVGGRSRRVTVSVGVAQFPVDGHSPSEVMRAADAALYQAKRAGRDRWSVAVSDLTAELPPALEEVSLRDVGQDSPSGSAPSVRDR